MPKLGEGGGQECLVAKSRADRGRGVVSLAGDGCHAPHIARTPCIAACRMRRTKRVCGKV